MKHLISILFLLLAASSALARGTPNDFTDQSGFVRIEDAPRALIFGSTRISRRIEEKAIKVLEGDPAFGQKLLHGFLGDAQSLTTREKAALKREYRETYIRAVERKLAEMAEQQADAYVAAAFAPARVPETTDDDFLEDVYSHVSRPDEHL